MFNRKLKEENIALKHEVEMLKLKNNTLSDDISRSLDKIDGLFNEINVLKLDNINLNAELNKYSKADLIELDKQIKDKQSKLLSIESKLSEVDNKLYFQSINFDDIVESSQYYKDEIKRNRIKQREFFQSKQHYSINEEWYIDGDDKKGNMLSMFLISTCISSFNMMCDSLSKSVNASNYVNLSNKIERDFNSYNDKLAIFELKLNRNLLDLKLQEIKLHRDVSIKLQQEKEEKEYQHEILREQLKAEKEINKQQDILQRELLKYNAQLAKGKNVQSHIDEIKDKINHNGRILANVKCGYVYIISNASLGKDIYKIGVTKRDFDVRIDELSNASVPFLFKANCILYSDDCFALESALHKEFEQYKVNKINPRKEFFKIPLDKIEKVVHNKYDANAIFNYSNVDDNFYASGYKICENFVDME